MSSEFWTYSTKLPGTSSGGLLPIPFGKPSTPQSFHSEIYIDFSEPMIVFQATVDSIDAEVMLKRLLSHAILTMVPDDGMDEVMSSLRDIVEFYYEPRQPLLPQARRSYAARVGRVTERPDLLISE